jgi:site-specific recombinase XerD
MPEPAAALSPLKLAGPWSRIASLAIDSVSSRHSKRAYARALEDFLTWYAAEERPPLSRAVVQQYRSRLEASGLSPASVNLRLSAIRKLASEAAENGLLDRGAALGIASLRNVRQAGGRVGNWLTLEQSRQLLACPEAGTLEGKRDRAVLAMLLGCGLRRAELAGLDFRQIQQRDGRWLIVDLAGKGRRLRTVACPAFVTAATTAWVAAAGITGGPLFRRIRSSPKTAHHSLSERMVWHIVAKYARQLGIDRLAPHDLRRTCARLCRSSGGELEQIQFLLGHASIQTTERYLGSRQNLRDAVNDRLGLDG